MTIRRNEALGQVRTKIVATIGPASRDPQILRELFDAGVDVVRLNFSHGTHDDHSAMLETVRRVANEADRQIAVLQDLGGPKIRLGAIPGGEVDCALGAKFRLVADRTSDDPTELTCTYRELPQDLKVGDVLLFADGAVIMNVTAVDDPGVKLLVTLAGKLRSNQGINLPGADLKINALTEKDLRDLDWTAAHQVEYVGLSFVRRAADVDQLRAELAARNCKARIVAKIEKPEAVDDLDAIIARTDAVMVARGDLGVEMDVAQVPAIQKRIISACHRARVPVITATQMLNSMEQSSRPTRAEASDVFNAVLDGTDAVMLSGETAMGLYPIEAVSTMSRIAAEAEALLFSSDYSGNLQPLQNDPRSYDPISATTDAVVEGASLVSRRLGTPLLVVATHSGRTALALSKRRNATRTLALADNAANARSMALYWGVTPLVYPQIADADEAMAFAIDWAKGQGLIKAGDKVVLVRGSIPGGLGHNSMLVQEVGPGPN